MDVHLYFLNVEVYIKLMDFYNADTFTAGLKSVLVFTKRKKILSGQCMLHLT